MRKKECPSCAMEIDAKLTVCPICGYELTDTGNRGLKWIALALAIFFLLYFILF